MGFYNMEHFLENFSSRTLTNLEFIEENKEAYGLYEVTQLINSLLGLVILPIEANKKLTYEDRILKDTDLKGINQNSFNSIRKIINRCQNNGRLFCDYYHSYNRNGEMYVSKFFDHLRNSLAHSGNQGIHFFPVGECTNITDIIFYDNDRSTHKNGICHEFCVKLTVNEVRELATAMQKMYCVFKNKNKDADNKVDKYNHDISKLESLMTSGRENNSKTIFEISEASQDNAINITESSSEA